eukprot:SAG25_NODE_3083_length_1226_cov_0.978705_2_plen_94_part_00
MDVDDPHEDGAKLLMILEGGNSPGYDRKHLGALRWRPHLGDDDRDAEQAATPVSTWVWTASPGGELERRSPRGAQADVQHLDAEQRLQQPDLC